MLVQRYQRDPARHELVVEDDGASNRHVFWKLDRTERVEVLAKVVNAQWPTVIFCRTKHGADRLAKQLGRAGVDAAAIHGDRSQGQRERALAAFAAGKVQALVATDVAARGIHVDDVAAVVHFDPPGSAKDYVHRSGRTGRGGASGLVVSLVDKTLAEPTNDLQRRLGFEPTLHWPDVAALESGAHDAQPLSVSDSRSSHRSSHRPQPQPRQGSRRPRTSEQRRTRTGAASRGSARRGR